MGLSGDDTLVTLRADENDNTNPETKMPTIGQKTTTIKKNICGDFVSKDGGFVGVLVKVAKNQFVICGVNTMLAIEWVSAEFASNQFAKHSTCPMTKQSNWTAK